MPLSAYLHFNFTLPSRGEEQLKVSEAALEEQEQTSKALAAELQGTLVAAGCWLVQLPLSPSPAPALHHWRSPGGSGSAIPNSGEGFREGGQEPFLQRSFSFQVPVTAVHCSALQRKDVSELKNFAAPPPLVQAVMEMVAQLFGCSTDWSTAKNLISESNFGKRYRDFDKERH